MRVKTTKRWTEIAKALYANHPLLRMATVAGMALDDRLACGTFDKVLHAQWFGDSVMKERNLDTDLFRRINWEW